MAFKLINETKKRLVKAYKMLTSASALNIITVSAFIIGVIALIALIYYQVRPMPLVDIKVPVSTEKPTYRAGDTVNGIFFGEVFFDGEVNILREVFCADYRARILTAEGDDIFRGVSRPIKLEGELRTIGELPADVPVGKNCIIQFVNSYQINTPFGTRVEQRTYYTQNFLIISDEGDSDQTDLVPDEPQRERLFDNQQETRPDTQEQSETRNTAPTDAPNSEQQAQKPAEPITQPRCAVRIFSLRLFC